MKMKDIKAGILRALYAEYEAHGAGGQLTLDELTEKVGALPNTIEAAVNSFKDAGLVDFQETLASLFDVHLTAEGIEAVEEPGTEAFELVQHVQHVTIAGGHVQLGNNNTQHVTYSTVLESLRSKIVNSDGGSDDKQQLVDAVDLLRRHPIASTKLTNA